MAETRRKCDQDFREGAVRLVREDRGQQGQQQAGGHPGSAGDHYVRLERWHNCPGGRLRPELIHGIKVGSMTPDFAHLAVLDVEHLDAVVLKLLARPLAADRDERDSVVVVGNNIMHLGTTGQRSIDVLGHAAILPLKLQD